MKHLCIFFFFFVEFLVYFDVYSLLVGGKLCINTSSDHVRLLENVAFNITTKVCFFLTSLTQLLCCF